MANRHEVIHQRYITTFEAVTKDLEAGIERSKKSLGNLSFDKNTEKHFQAVFKELERDLDGLKKKFGETITSPGDKAAIEKKLRDIATVWQNFGKELKDKGFNASEIFFKGEDFENIEKKIKKLKKEYEELGNSIKKNTSIGADISLTKEKKENMRRAASQGKTALKEKTKQEIKTITGSEDYQAAKKVKSKVEKSVGNKLTDEEALAQLQTENKIVTSLVEQNQRLDEAQKKIEAMNTALKEQEAINKRIAEIQGQISGSDNSDIVSKYGANATEASAKIKEEIAKAKSEKQPSRKTEVEADLRKANGKDVAVQEALMKKYNASDLEGLKKILSDEAKRQAQLVENNKLADQKVKKLQTELETLKEIVALEKEMAGLNTQSAKLDTDIDAGKEAMEQVAQETGKKVNAKNANKVIDTKKQQNQNSIDKENAALKENIRLLNEKITKEKEIQKIKDYSEALSGDAEKIDNISSEMAEQEAQKIEYVENASREAANELNNLQREVEEADNSFNKGKDTIDKYGKEVEEANKKASSFKTVTKYFTQFFGIQSILSKASQALRSAINDIKDLDKQLNDISIVTGKSMDELWGNFSKLNSLAQQYGVTTGDVVSVQKLYYQQGRSVAEVNELTGETLTFAKISGLEFGEATEYMTAAINAYKIEAQDAARITDTYAALSTQAAVDAQEVAVAMSKVASLAALSNTGFEDTSAYLAKIIETTREAPETAGTALKTVIARFTAVNKLTEDQKELLDDDYNFNNIEKALKTVGVSVKDSSGQMRGFADILEDLGPKWESLTENQKHYIATQAAGARQQSRFIALVDDWGRTQELMDVANNSAGTGAEQLELSMDSIESKLNQLKATWQSFYGSLTSSELFKWVVDSLNTILKVLDGIMDKTGVLGPVIIAGLAVAAKAFVKGAIDIATHFGRSFTTTWNSYWETSELKKAMKDLKNAKTKGYNEGLAYGRAYEKGRKVGEAGGNLGGNKRKVKIKKRGDGGSTISDIGDTIDLLDSSKNKKGKGGMFDKIKQFFGKGGAKDTTKTVSKVAKGADAIGDGAKVVKGASNATRTYAKVSKVASTSTKALGKTGKALSLVTKGASLVTKAGSGLAKVLSVVAKFGTKAIPVVGWILGILEAINLLMKVAQWFDEQALKKKTEKFNEATKSYEKAMDRNILLTEKYTRIKELERKGIAKTAEETEEYQSLLKQLQNEYPKMVQKTEDGMLTLSENADSLVSNLQETNKNALKMNAKTIYENAEDAMLSGRYATTKATEAADQIKSGASLVGEMDEATIRDLSHSNVKLKSEDFVQISQQGLTYDAVKSSLGWWGQQFFSPEQFEKILKDYSKETEKTGQNYVDVEGINDLSGNTKKIYAMLNTINSQLGTNIVQELIKGNANDEILASKIEDSYRIYETENNVTVSETVKENTKEYAKDIYNNIIKGEYKLDAGTASVWDDLTPDNTFVESKTYEDLLKRHYTASDEDKSKVAQQVTIDYKIAALKATGEFDEKQTTNIEKISEKFKNSQVAYDDALETLNAYGNNLSDEQFDKFWEAVNGEGSDILEFDEADIAAAVQEHTDKMVETYTKLPDQERKEFEGQIEQLSHASMNMLNKANLSNWENFDEMEKRAEGFGDYLKQIYGDEIAEFKKLIEDQQKIIYEMGPQLKTAWQEYLNTVNLATLTMFSEKIRPMYEHYGQQAGTAFGDKFLTYYSEHLSGNSVLQEAVGSVDFFDSESIAEAAAEIYTLYGDKAGGAYAQFTDLVNHSSNLLDRDFKNIEQVIASAATTIENLESSLDKLQKANSGSLDIQGVGDLLTEYSFLDISDFEATADGFKLNSGNLSEVRKKMVESEKAEYSYLGNMAAAQNTTAINKLKNEHDFDYDTYYKLLQKQKNGQTLEGTEKETMESLTSQMNTTGIQDIVNKALSSGETVTMYEKVYDLISQIDTEYAILNEQLSKEIDQLKLKKDLLEQIGEYNDIDAYMSHLERRIKQYDFELELSLDDTNLINTAKDKLSAITELMNSNMAKAQRATSNTEARRKSLEDYVSFDDHGNILTDEKEIAGWADRISKMPTNSESERTTQQREKEVYDSVLQQIEAYRTEQQMIDDCTSSAQEYAKQLEEIVTSMKEDVVAMEDKFRDLFIQRDEEALDSLKERYDAMKQMDEDYLESVREAIDEERRLRDRSNSEEDLAKMERQLQLMRMSGGSTTEIQSLEQELAQKRQDMADTYQDDMVSNLEKNIQQRSAERDEEVTYQEQVLEEKKQNQILYNQEIAQLMQQDKDTIMATWMMLDSEFQSSTTTNKELLVAEMEAMVAKGLSSKDLLAGDYIPAIEEAYINLKNEIDIDTQAMEDFSKTVTEAGNKSGEVIQGIESIGDSYLGVNSVIQKSLIPTINTLNSKLLETIGYQKEALANQANFTGEGFVDPGHEGDPPPKEKEKASDIQTSRKIEYDINRNRIAEQSGGTWTYGNSIEVGSTYTLDGKSENGGGKMFREMIRDTLAGGGRIYLTGEGGKAENGQPIFRVASTVSGINSHAISWDAVQKYFGINTSLDTFVQTYEFTVPESWKKRGVKAFATGGMVDFTGPAWVDGTPSKPEAFLSANDTSLIAGLRDVLRANPSFITQPTSSIQKTGDTYYEIHINVDELGEGYSVDDLMDELEDRIVQSADKNTVIKIAR